LDMPLVFCGLHVRNDQVEFVSEGSCRIWPHSVHRAIALGRPGIVGRFSERSLRL
jgi:hypothetical protein